MLLSAQLHSVCAPTCHHVPAGALPPPRSCTRENCTRTRAVTNWNDNGAGGGGASQRAFIVFWLNEHIIFNQLCRDAVTGFISNCVAAILKHYTGLTGICSCAAIILSKWCWLLDHWPHGLLLSQKEKKKHTGDQYCIFYFGNLFIVYD